MKRPSRGQARGSSERKQAVSAPSFPQPPARALPSETPEITGSIVALEPGRPDSALIARAKVRVPGLGELHVAIVKGRRGDPLLVPAGVKCDSARGVFHRSDAIAFDPAFSARIIAAVAKRLSPGEPTDEVSALLRRSAARASASPSERAAARDELFQRGERGLEAATAGLG